METASSPSEWLNYHHLRRFWVIARERTMTQAAVVLHVSQSTLSEQVRELEDWMGQKLFDRRGRRLHLTEAGQAAFEHAETIFKTGDHLMDLFRGRAGPRMRVVRIGAVGPLSKNLQYDLIRPWLGEAETQVLVAAGSFSDLLQQLRDHQLDMVISNMPPRTDIEPQIQSHPLGEMPVFLVGRRSHSGWTGQFPAGLTGVPLFLPTRQSHVRAEFDRLLDHQGIKPVIRAEVDDMALLRLLALSGQGLALVPAIVVRHELGTHRLPEAFRVPGVDERFYALTQANRFGAEWINEALIGFRERLRRLAEVPGAAVVSPGTPGPPAHLLEPVRQRVRKTAVRSPSKLSPPPR